MKTITQRLMKILLVTLMMIIPLGINNSVVYGEDTGNTYELKEGVVYKIGDTIKLSKDTWIVINDYMNSRSKIISGYYFLSKPDDFVSPGQFRFEGLFIDSSSTRANLRLGDGLDLTGNETVTGIKCVDGDGVSENTAYQFELMFATSTDPTVIDEIEFTITPPVPGVTVSGDWNEQENRPEVSVPSNAKYNVYESAVFWINENYTIFNGKFVENEYYYFVVPLNTEDGYTFVEEPNDLTVNITNGELVIARYVSGGVAIYGKVKCQPKIIDKVEFTLIPPRAGDYATLNLGNNLPDPITIIPDNAPFEVDTDKDIYWEDSKDAFSGMFKAGNDYFTIIYLRAKEGYRFADSPTVTINGKSIPDSNYLSLGTMFNTRVKVQCTQQHKVTFVLNGGTMNTTETYVNDGEYLDISKFEPKKTGQYRFDGWYTDPQCKNYFSPYETKIEAPITLYAKWEGYYLAIADFNGGNRGGDTGFEMPIPLEGYEEAIPTNDEMIYDWEYEAPEGMRYVGVNINGRQYKPGDVAKVKENVLITTIHFPINKDVLTFDLDGGKLGDQVGVAFLPYDNGEDIMLPAPTKDGATFDYWEGSKYYAGDPYTVNGDKVFKAVWKTNPTPKPNYSIPKTGVE